MDEHNNGQFSNTISRHLNDGNRVAVIQLCMDYHREQLMKSIGLKSFLDPRDAWDRFLDDLTIAWYATDEAESRRIIDGLISVPGSIAQMDELELLSTLVARLEERGFSGVPLILMRMLNEIEEPRILIEAILTAKCQSNVLVDACFDAGLATIKDEGAINNINSLGFISRLSRGLATKNTKSVVNHVLRIFDAIDSLSGNLKSGNLMDMMAGIAVMLFESEEDGQSVLMHQDIFNVAQRLDKKYRIQSGNAAMIYIIRYQIAVCHALCSIIESISENEHIPSSIVERISSRLIELVQRQNLLSTHSFLVIASLAGYSIRLGDNESAMLLLNRLISQVKGLEKVILWPEFQVVVPTALALMKNNQEKKAKQLVEKYYPIMLKRWWVRHFELRFKRSEIVRAIIYAIQANAQLHNNIEVTRLFHYVISASRQLNGDYIDLDKIVQTLIDIGYSKDFSTVYFRVLRIAEKKKTLKTWATAAALCLLVNPLDQNLLRQFVDKTMPQETDSAKKDVAEVFVNILSKVPQVEIIKNDLITALVIIVESMTPSSSEKRETLLTILSYCCASDNKDEFKMFKTMLLRKLSIGNKFGFPLTMSLIGKLSFRSMGLEKSKVVWDQVWIFADKDENEKEIRATICEDMAEIAPTDALALAMKITDSAYQARTLCVIGQEFIKSNKMSEMKDVLDRISKCLDVRINDRIVLRNICKLLLDMPDKTLVDPFLKIFFRYLIDKPLLLKFVLAWINNCIKNPVQVTQIQETLASIAVESNKRDQTRFRCLVAEFFMETGNKEKALAFLKATSYKDNKENDLEFLTPHLPLIARFEVAAQLVRLGEDKKEDIQEILSEINGLSEGDLIPWKVAISSRIGCLLYSIKAPEEGDEWFRKANEMVKNPAWQSDKRHQQIRVICTELATAGRVDWAIDLLRSINNITEKELLIEALCETIQIEDLQSLENILDLASTNSTRIKIIKMLFDDNSIGRQLEKIQNIIIKFIDYAPTLDLVLRTWTCMTDEFQEDLTNLVCIETK